MVCLRTNVTDNDNNACSLVRKQQRTILPYPASIRACVPSGLVNNKKKRGVGGERERERERERDCLVIALRPQTPKHIRCGWSHYTDTSEPVDEGVGTLQL
jgi:hypothetical protein